MNDNETLSRFRAAASDYFSQNPLEKWIPKTLSGCIKNTLDEVEDIDDPDKIKEVLADHCHEAIATISFICEMNLIYFNMVRKQ